MDYSIRVYRINKENSNLRGFVSITFENSFCAKNIALKESAKGNLYLEMPKYQEFETGEYIPYFSFKDKDFRRAVTAQAIEAYHQISGEEKMIDVESEWEDEEMYYDLSVSPIRGKGGGSHEDSRCICNSADACYSGMEWENFCWYAAAGKSADTGERRYCLSYQWKL